MLLNHIWVGALIWKFERNISLSTNNSNENWHKKRRFIKEEGGVFFFLLSANGFQVTLRGIYWLEEKADSGISWNKILDNHPYENWWKVPQLSCLANWEYVDIKLMMIKNGRRQLWLLMATIFCFGYRDIGSGTAFLLFNRWDDEPAPLSHRVSTNYLLRLNIFL